MPQLHELMTLHVGHSRFVPSCPAAYGLCHGLIGHSASAGHQQSECPKKAVDVYRLPDQLQSKVDEMYAKVRRVGSACTMCAGGCALWSCCRHRPTCICSRPILFSQDVARMNPGEAVKMDHEYKSFLAELGGGPAPPEDGGGPRGGVLCVNAAQMSNTQPTCFYESGPRIGA